MTTEIREFYIKRVPVDVQERLTARDEAQVMLVMDSFAAHRTESDRANIKALVEALHEHGIHDSDCACANDVDANRVTVIHAADCKNCDCGLAAALKLAGGE